MLSATLSMTLARTELQLTPVNLPVVLALPTVWQQRLCTDICVRVCVGGGCYLVSWAHSFFSLQ